MDRAPQSQKLVQGSEKPRGTGTSTAPVRDPLALKPERIGTEVPESARRVPEKLPDCSPRVSRKR